MFQPRFFPAEPELISIGDNVKIAAGVKFTTHDVISSMLNCKYNTHKYNRLRGGISIGNNVMIGADVRFLPDVRVGDNVIIGAGAIVTKDIPSNCVAAGVPARVIGDFDTFVEKRGKYVAPTSAEELWTDFDSRVSVQPHIS